MWNNRIRYEDIKKYCIPNLRAFDDEGNEYPVITTIQSNYEWYMERKKTLYYKRLSIAELAMIVLLLATVGRGHN